MRYRFKQIGEVRQTFQKQKGLCILLALLWIICTDVTALPVTVQARMERSNHATNKANKRDIYIEGQTTQTKIYTASLQKRTTHVEGQSMQSDPQTSHMHPHSKFVVPSSMIATFKEIRMPLGITLPIDITRGSEGSYWVSDLQGNAIDNVHTDGAITSYTLPNDNDTVQGITTDNDGEIWFDASNNIGYIKADGTVTEFPIARHNTSSLGITSGPDGAIWFTEDMMNRIGRLTTKGDVTEYVLPQSNSDPTDITQGPDGALWFVESMSDRIGRLSTTGILTEFPLPTKDAYPFSIISGPNDALWFTERNTNSIGSLTPDGHFTEFNVPTSASVLSRIGNIGDGTLAFSEEKANQIGRINAEGMITEFPLPTDDALPFSIINGGPGTIWFTETNIGHVSSLTFPPVATTQPDLSIQQQHTGTAPLSIGKHADITVTINSTPSSAAITQEKAITLDEIIPAGLSNIHVIGGPDWRIILTQATSPSLIHGTYIGSYPIAPGTRLPQIVIGGTVSASAIPALITTGLITIPNNSNFYDDIATDKIIVATS